MNWTYTCKHNIQNLQYFGAVLPYKAGTLWLLMRGNALFTAEESCSRTIGMSGLLSLEQWSLSHILEFFEKGWTVVPFQWRSLCPFFFAPNTSPWDWFASLMNKQHFCPLPASSMSCRNVFKLVLKRILQSIFVPLRGTCFGGWVESFLSSILSCPLPSSSPWPGAFQCLPLQMNLSWFAVN